MSEHRVHIYCRVSSAGQEDGFSLDTQEQACRAWCAERNLSVASAVREVWSGTDRHRPKLDALIERVLPGDVVLAYALDRLSRSQVDTAILIDRIESTGASLALVTEDFEKSATGTFLRGAKAFAAELEREKIAERTQRGRRARVSSGKPLAGNRPSYGYRWADAAKSRLELDPINADVVRRIFDMALEGRSLRGIAADLYERSVPSPTGSPRWTPAVIRDLLLRPIYTGHAVGYATRSERRPGGGYVRRVSTAEERVPLPGIAPAIVSPLEAATVGQRMATNKAQAIRNNRNPEATLLRAGFVKCGHCGWAMNVRTPSMSSRNRSPSYRCTSRTQRGHDCPQPTIAASLLDDAVWSKVAELLRDPHIIAREVERHRQDGGLERDHASVQKQIESLADKQARIAKRVGDIEDDAVVAPLIAELASLADRKKAAETELSIIKKRIADHADEDAKVQSLTAWCARVGANLDHLNYNERRLALEALGVQIKVYSHRISGENGDQHPRWTLMLRSVPWLS